MIQVKVTGNANRLLERLRAEMGPETRRVIAQMCMRIEADAKRQAPSGVSSRLRTSITHEVAGRGNTIEGRVGTNVEYAPFVHGELVGGQWKGPRRHFVPFSVAPGLKLWLKRKAGWDPKRLDKMKGIMVGGKPPQPFLIPLLAKYRPEILDELRQAIMGVN
jgi:hypothetical protein